MPDFEALIRHQQLRQPTTNQRLKVVESDEFEKEKSEHLKFNNPKILNNFLVSFVGSVIGTLTIVFLYVNEYIPIDLIKIK